MGDEAYATLVTLATDPESQRQGAAKALLEDGLRRVDEMVKGCFVCASVMGKGLYEQYGFEAVGKIPFDARKYLVMVRVTHGICVGQRGSRRARRARRARHERMPGGRRIE